jgi:uncharacterized peroxidase-related enzyme
MPRVQKLEIGNASKDVKPFLDAVMGKIGKVPNFFATIANSPKTASAFSQFNSALVESNLSVEEREAIALCQASFHGCPYCSAAHTAIAQSSGVDETEVILNRIQRSSNTRTQAVIDFTIAVLNDRGAVTDFAIKAFKNAGFEDAHIVDVIAVITANTFTNYVNLVAQTDVDFPPVKISEAKA